MDADQEKLKLGKGVAVERPPTVSDMARLLADAMRRPADGRPRRPESLRIRARRQWQELVPHLRQLGMRVVPAPRLARWDKAFKEFSRGMLGPVPALLQPEVEELYPAVAEYVRTTGWIEVGDQEGFGFVARALDYGGLVFESRKVRSLGEAMAALERALSRGGDPS